MIIVECLLVNGPMLSALLHFYFLQGRGSYPFCRWRNWGPERFRHLPKFTQLEPRSACVWLQSQTLSTTKTVSKNNHCDPSSVKWGIWVSNIVGKNTGSKFIFLGFKSWPIHLVAVWPRASLRASRCLVCAVGVVIVTCHTAVWALNELTPVKALSTVPRTVNAACVSCYYQEM